METQRSEDRQKEEKWSKSEPFKCSPSTCDAVDVFVDKNWSVFLFRSSSLDTGLTHYCHLLLTFLFLMFYIFIVMIQTKLNHNQIKLAQFHEMPAVEVSQRFRNDQKLVDTEPHLFDGLVRKSQNSWLVQDQQTFLSGPVDSFFYSKASADALFYSQCNVSDLLTSCLLWHACQKVNTERMAGVLVSDNLLESKFFCSLKRRKEASGSLCR